MRKCFSVHTVEEYLRLADQCERAALRDPKEAKELIDRARIFRRLASKRKPRDAREDNFYR